MEKKRFNEKRKVNQTSMICYAVLVFILFAAYMLELVKGNRTVGYIMIFDIILLVPLALALLTYKKNNESAALRYMITAGYGVLYVFVLLTSVTKLSFVYIIPMIIILTLYRDWKLVLAAGAAAIAANVIFVFYYLGSKNEAGPFRCINRLDKDTTGITILAKNSLSGGILGRQMNERKIHRTYLAIVRGITPESGTITAPIGRKEGSVLERQVDIGQGEYACTHYFRLAVKEIFPKNTFSREPLSPDALSLIALRLDTGRTHQIRVHMSYFGYPLIGDFLYNPDFSLTKRQALHACQLKFEHPITKAQLCFTAPLPADMQMLFPEFHVPDLDNLYSD